MGFHPCSGLGCLWLQWAEVGWYMTLRVPIHLKVYKVVCGWCLLSRLVCPLPRIHAYGRHFPKTIFLKPRIKSILMYQMIRWWLKVNNCHLFLSPVASDLLNMEEIDYPFPHHSPTSYPLWLPRYLYIQGKYFLLLVLNGNFSIFNIDLYPDVSQNLWGKVGLQSSGERWRFLSSVL